MKFITAILFIAFTFQLKGQTELKKSKPFVLGVIDEIYSHQLQENRILNIYLPEGYNLKDTISYPVIYVLDGSADEDFIHITGIIQYYSFEWINLLPKSILVGIATVDRRRDFTFPTTIAEDKVKFPTSGHSEQFISFIEKELQPYIEKKYKTNPSKTIIGQSFGGLLSTEILLKKPELFTQYIIVSPSIWWDNGSILNIPVRNIENKQIYIGVGKEGLTPTIQPRVMEVDANVLADKIKSKTQSVYFDYLPDEDHATIMHQAVMNAFKQLFKMNSAK
jgi:predicted alpha/beta superfamily hydrolase